MAVAGCVLGLIFALSGLFLISSLGIGLLAGAAVGGNGGQAGEVEVLGAVRMRREEIIDGVAAEACAVGVQGAPVHVGEAVGSEP